MAYPDTIDTLPKPDNTKRMNDAGFEGPASITAISNAIEAIQTELGTNPSGGSATVGVRIEAVEDLVDAADTLIEYGSHTVRWDGTDWNYRGAVITARPTNVPAWPDGDVLWDTSLDATVTDPPTLAAVGDKWLPHGSVTP